MGSAAVAPLNLSDAGSWLCARHTTLRDLVKEIPGAYVNGGPVMWKVRDAVRDFDMAMVHAEKSVLRLMSPSQVGRLRLLATLAPRGASPWSGAVQFCVDDLKTFHAVDSALLEDWLRCVRIGVIG